MEKQLTLFDYVPDAFEGMEETENLKTKLQDLESSLSLENHPWNSWEFDFIKNFRRYSNRGYISPTCKQAKKINELWDRL